MKWILCIIGVFVFVQPVFAQEFNAGFVQGLWYSQDTIFADKPVRIYVAIRNNTGVDMTGTVEFLDNGKRIERVPVSALNGRIVEQWADWTPTYGEHTITATLSRTKLQAVGENAEPISVTSSLAKDTFFVDLDTDGDGVGNAEDIDDDGDGISDEVELQNGTDPLNHNDPPDTQESAKEAETPTPSETATSTTENQPNAPPQGLERYLTPSRADAMLGSITQTVTTAKEKLDTYRRARAVANGTAKPSPEEDIQVNADGFGEITRTTKKDSKAQKTQTKKETPAPPAEKTKGFWSDLISTAGTVLNSVYTGILAALSFILGYPVLIQLFLLFGILFLLFKTAQKLGGRPT